MEEVQEVAIVDNLEVAQTKKPRYRSPVAVSIYGEDFQYYQKLSDYNDLLPLFKDWYYQKKIANNKEAITFILRSFNSEVCAPLGRTFHPNLNRVRSWRSKWDMELIEQTKNLDYKVVEGRSIRQVVKTRDERNELMAGDIEDSALERGVKTLGGELTNDALQMLRDDQELEETMDNETMIKRRNYITNVFAHVTRLVHGKAALMLKASEEKRNNTGFLMDILARASAGKITDDEIAFLKGAYAPKVDSNMGQPNEQ